MSDENRVMSDHFFKPNKALAVYGRPGFIKEMSSFYLVSMARSIGGAKLETFYSAVQVKLTYHWPLTKGVGPTWGPLSLWEPEYYSVSM